MRTVTKTVCKTGSITVTSLHNIPRNFRFNFSPQGIKSARLANKYCHSSDHYIERDIDIHFNLSPERIESTNPSAGQYTEQDYNFNLSSRGNKTASSSELYAVGDSNFQGFIAIRYQNRHPSEHFIERDIRFNLYS